MKDVHLYLAQNKIPRTWTLAGRYLLLDSLLFRLNTTPRKELTGLAIPESGVVRII